MVTGHSGTLRELPTDLIQPGWGGEGVGAEGFEVAFLLVVVKGAVEAEVGCFGRLNEAGAVVGTHLKEDAHFDLAEGLAAHETVDVIEAVDGCKEVDAVAAAISDEVVHLVTGIAGVTVPKAEVVFVPQFFEALQLVDEEEDRLTGGLCIRLAIALAELGGDVLHDLGDVLPS